MTDSDFAKAILALDNSSDDAMDFSQKVTDLCAEYRNQAVEAPAQHAKVGSCAYYVKGDVCAYDSRRPCYPEGACLPTRNRSTVG